MIVVILSFLKYIYIYICIYILYLGGGGGQAFLIASGAFAAETRCTSDPSHAFAFARRAVREPSGQPELLGMEEAKAGGVGWSGRSGPEWAASGFFLGQKSEPFTGGLLWVSPEIFRAGLYVRQGAPETRGGRKSGTCEKYAAHLWVVLVVLQPPPKRGLPKADIIIQGRRGKSKVWLGKGRSNPHLHGVVCVSKRVQHSRNKLAPSKHTHWGKETRKHQINWVPRTGTAERFSRFPTCPAYYKGTPFELNGQAVRLTHGRNLGSGREFSG